MHTFASRPQPDTTTTLAARHAACLVYALRAPTDRAMQRDVAWAAGECGVDDELDVYGALDDLAAAVEALTS